MPQASFARVNSAWNSTVGRSFALCIAGLFCGFPLAEPTHGWPATSIAESPSRPQDHQVALAVSLVKDGRRADAEQIYRRVLRENPHDDQAYQALVDLSDSRILPLSSSACESAQRRLPEAFNLYETERFVLLSDADDQFTAQQARWVERTYEEFQRFAKNCGLQPLPLEHKLVCVLFENHEEYQSFAQTQDGVTSTAITGYYSPRHDRVVFSLHEQAANASHGRDSDDRKGQTGQVKTVLGFDSTSEAAAAPDHLQLAEGRGADGHGHVHTTECGGEIAAKCVHETIHQLMFHTRIMSREVQYPLWMCEGLSTAFETHHPEQAFGPDQNFAPRREAFQSLLRRNDLLMLSDLVSLAQLPGGSHHNIRTVYHQSYALVTWLCKERASQVRSYLQAMLKEPAGRLSRNRHLELFEQSFGDVDAVEQTWLEHERAAIGQSFGSP